MPHDLFHEIEYIRQKLKLSTKQVKASIELLDQGDRIPFIARYRKEKTYGLDEVQLRAIEQNINSYRQLQSRKQVILQKLQEQQQLTQELRAAINDADQMTLLEDLYSPFKIQRKSKAQVAIDCGLSMSAHALLAGRSWWLEAQKHRCDTLQQDQELKEAVYELAAHIIAQNHSIRTYLLENFHQHLEISSTLKKGKSAEEYHVYQHYFTFQTRVRFLKPHQVLALQRGEKLSILQIRFHIEEDRIWHTLMSLAYQGRSSLRSNPYVNDIQQALHIAYQKKLKGSISKTIWRSKQSDAHTHSIQAFAQNLKALLLSPPLLNHCVFAIDPGLRTGSKYAVVNAQGRLLDHGVFYTHDQRKYQSIEHVKKIIINQQVQAIAIGNGTGSREAEWVVNEVLPQLPSKVNYALVDEAGASVYSASEIARQEFPHLDVSERGAVSIARRLQDPLAELIKIDVQSMGIGMYQHDVNQSALQAQVKGVVEDAVNSVGADLNTASVVLLQYIAGLGPKTAHAIVEYRDQYGAFRTRKALLKVKGLGLKTYEQCAGFLRVYGGDEPLDTSAVHPEGYPFINALLERLEIKRIGQELKALFTQHQNIIQQLAQTFAVGSLTLNDRLQALVQAGRDVRADLPPPLMRSHALSIEQLQEGQILKGKVSNVVDFGAFIDLGIKQAGLLHISEIKNEYVQDPYAELKVGQVFDVKILSIDLKRSRISVSRKACL